MTTIISTAEREAVSANKNEDYDCFVCGYMIIQHAKIKGCS